MLRRGRQFAVNGAGDRVNKLRPVGVERPEVGAALAAEMPFVGAYAVPCTVRDTGSIDFDLLLAFDDQGFSTTTQVDKVPTSAAQLAADAAIAMLEGDRFVAF